MTIAIETAGLTRTYRDAVALDDVSVRIRRNVITGLLGRNGAGKTTLMSLMTAQDRPSSGRVSVFGEDPFENEAALAQLCFIRDNQRYPDDYRLKHAVRAASICYPNWDQALADELIDLFRIPERTAIKKFSRGQFSAVGITLGLASRAPITFFDEPYLGLDATARGIFYDVLLRDYAEHPRTVVLSTHLIDEMDRLLEHVVVLDRGRVLRDTDADELRGSAFRVSGAAGAVDAFLTDRPVLDRHAVGPLATAIVEGDEREAARAAGLDVGTVTLQELVAAFGLTEGDAAPGRTPSETAVRA